MCVFLHGPATCPCQPYCPTELFVLLVMSSVKGNSAHSPRRGHQHYIALSPSSPVVTRVLLNVTDDMPNSSEWAKFGRPHSQLALGFPSVAGGIQF